MENRVLVIAGPTCVGKSAVALEVALSLGSAIISADSMQVYRGMDIGTGKPAIAERSIVPHHLIDIAEPSEDFSAGRFKGLASGIIQSLHCRDIMPLIVGGTGLYLAALTRGLFDAPEADWALRDELLSEPLSALHARLETIDPEAARKISPTDRRRIVRALEVSLSAGDKNISELRADGTAALPCEFIKLCLTRQREELYAMIEARVDHMMELGLVEEVRALLLRNPSRGPMQAIGYKEIAAHLRGEATIEDAVSLIKRNTRRYAKRQFTWFRKEEGMRWIDVSGARDAGEILERVRPALLEAGVTI